MNTSFQINIYSSCSTKSSISFKNGVCGGVGGGVSGGKVIGYDTSIHLKNVKFLVGLRGNKQVRPIELGGEGKNKNVHAGVVGEQISSGFDYNTDGWIFVRYNPREGHKTFIIESTNTPIHEASEVILKNSKEVWVKL